MEFKLNKIDTDLRQKVHDQTKEGKVHSKNSIKVQKDKHDESGEKKDFKEFFSEEENKSKKIKVFASKNEKLDVEAQLKEDDSSPKGIFLDVRK